MSEATCCHHAGFPCAEIYRGTPVSNQLATVFGRLAQCCPTNFPLIRDGAGPFLLPCTTAKPWMPGLADGCAGGFAAGNAFYSLPPFDAEKTEPGKMSRINPYHIANLQGEWYVFGVHAGMTM